MNAETIREQVIEHIVQHGQSDIYPMCPEFSWIRHHPEALATILETHDNANSQGKLGYFRQPIRELFRTGGTKYRLGTLLDPVMALQYLEHALLLATKTPSLKSSRAHSCHLAAAEASEVFDPSFNWHSFSTASSERAHAHNYVLCIDLANFYGSFTEEKLCETWRRLSIDPTHRALMVSMLRFLNINTHGLPVGSDGSRLLAELSLNLIDRELSAHNIEFCRFVDDYRLYGNSKSETARLASLMHRIVTSLGFAVNSAKTCLQKTSDVIEIEALHRTTSARLVNDQTNDAWTVACFEDPYSAAIVERIGELELTANVDSIEKLLLREFEKIEPSHKNLSIIIQALNFTAIEDCAFCLGRLFALIQEHQLFSLLPKTLSLIQLRSTTLSEHKKHYERCLHQFLASVSSSEGLAPVAAQLFRLARLLQLEVEPAVFNAARQASEASIFLSREIAFFRGNKAGKIHQKLQGTTPWACFELEDHRGQ